MKKLLLSIIVVLGLATNAWAPPPGAVVVKDGNVTPANPNYGMMVGGATSITAPFRVDTDGTIYMDNNAKICMTNNKAGYADSGDTCTEFDEALGGGHGDGANCAVGEIPLGVDASGAVQECYEPTEADIADLNHTATAVQDGLIVEADLNADSAPNDNEILTYDPTGANFDWHTLAELNISATNHTHDSTYQSYDGMLQDIADLTDPNVDRIMYWDETTNSIDWLIVSTGLDITDTELTATASAPLLNDILSPDSNASMALTTYSLTFTTQNESIVMGTDGSVSARNYNSLRPDGYWAFNADNTASRKDTTQGDWWSESGTPYFSPNGTSAEEVCIGDNPEFVSALLSSYGVIGPSTGANGSMTLSYTGNTSSPEIVIYEWSGATDQITIDFEEPTGGNYTITVPAVTGTLLTEVSDRDIETTGTLGGLVNSKSATANTTITAADCDGTFWYADTTDAITFTLPEASTAGANNSFICAFGNVANAGTVTVDVAAGDILMIGSTVLDAGDKTSSGDTNAMATFLSVGDTYWNVTLGNGSWSDAGP